MSCTLRVSIMNAERAAGRERAMARADGTVALRKVDKVRILEFCPLYLLI